MFGSSVDDGFTTGRLSGLWVVSGPSSLVLSASFSACSMVVRGYECFVLLA